MKATKTLWYNRVLFNHLTNDTKFACDFANGTLHLSAQTAYDYLWNIKLCLSYLLLFLHLMSLVFVLFGLFIYFILFIIYW